MRRSDDKKVRRSEAGRPRPEGLGNHHLGGEAADLAAAVDPQHNKNDDCFYRTPEGKTKVADVDRHAVKQLNSRASQVKYPQGPTFP